MTDTLSPPPARFPTWVVAGGLLLAAAYLPTLTAPFDFVDDGNLVYPTSGLTLSGHVRLWWQKVAANVEHLGPFRPTLWAHWQLAANVFHDDAGAWRATRLAWCGLAAVTLLWLLRELNLHPTAALLATAAAMWNPYRNEIWTSLTLAEGVAMPYALFALVAARKAVGSPRPWRWDAAALLALLIALGCKNVFVALIPPMLMLRTWADGGTLRTGVRAHGLRAAVYLLPVAVPVAHFVYFKLHPAPHHYETPGPSWEQAKQFALWLKGAAGVDFLAVGVLLAAGAVVWRNRAPSPPTPLPQRGEGGQRMAVCFGLTLLVCGFVVYLPVNIMTGRYTMPAVWGVDVLLAVLLTRFVALPPSWPTRLAWVGIAVGLVAVAVAGVNRQEKTAARSKLLWDMLARVEQTVPHGSTVAWVSGASETGELNTEEGIHFAWHLLHRGRIDVRIALADADGNRIERVELPPASDPPRFRIAAHPSGDTLNWQTSHTTTVGYRFGTKVFNCVMEERRATETPSAVDPVTDRMMRDALSGFDPVKKLLEKPTGGPAEAKRK